MNGKLTRTNIDHALAYAQLGWHVLPVWSVDEHGQCRCGKNNNEKGHKPGKHPHARLAPHGHHNASSDEAVIRRWWSIDPDAGIGISLADSGLLALDIDPQNGGDATLAALEAEHGVLHSDCMAITQGGGEHRLFTADPDLAFPGTLGAGLDLKHHGYICVAPTLGASGTYAWAVGCSPLSKSSQAQPSALPPFILSKARAPVNFSLTERGGVPVATAQTFDDLRSALKHVDADDYATWVNVGMVLKPYGENGYKVWTEWAATSDKFDAAAQRKKWDRDLSTPHSITYRSIFRMAIDSGWANNATEAEPLAINGLSTDEIPTNLFETRQPAEFDVDRCLPAPIAQWVKSHADATGLQAVSYAFAALPVLAAATNHNVRINLGSGHNVPVILWAGIVGVTGSGKSPVMIAAHKPISQLHTEEVRRANQEKTARRYRGNKDDLPTLTCVRYCADTTPEALTKNLSISDGPRILLHFDEGSGWLNQMGRYSSGSDADRATYLSSWLGLQDHAISRIGRGEIYVPELGTNILMGITPNKINEGYKEASAEGLLARMLICLIDRSKHQPQKKGVEKDLVKVNAEYGRLVRKLTKLHDLELRLSSEAQEIFDELRKKLGYEAGVIEETYPGLAAMLAKAAENLGRIAGLYCLCQLTDRMTSPIIDTSHITMAKSFMDVAITHALAAYTGQLVTDEPTKVARDCALKILRLHQGTPALKEVSREQLRKVPSFSQADQTAQTAAINLLQYSHWLTHDTTQRQRGGGNRFADATRWRINPIVFDGRFLSVARDSFNKAQEVHRTLIALGKVS